MFTVPFESFGSSIIRATVAADKASGKSRDVISQAFGQFLDACSIAGIPRDEEGCKALGEEIRTCQAFLDGVPMGTIEKNTVTNYAQSAMRAYYHDVAWYASAFLSEEKGGLPALPWSKGAAKSGARNGKVSVTTDKDLMLTIRKALEQCTLLNRDVIKSILIDAGLELDPDFKV